MIHTSRIITVGKEESTLNYPIMLYRGDRQVEVDFNFVGGYQGNNSELGEYKWATNRNDTPDSWRDNSHSGYPQIITLESSYNKMMVGSNIVGTSCSVTIPEDAIGMSIIFGASSGNECYEEEFRNLFMWNDYE